MDFYQVFNSLYLFVSLTLNTIVLFEYFVPSDTEGDNYSAVYNIRGKL